MNRRVILTTAASLVIGVVAGTGIMMNDQAYQSVKQVVGGSATNNSLGQIDLSGMDIETALQAVQQDRAQLLENQLKDQMAAVQQNNETIAELNNLLSELSGVRGQSAADGHYALSDSITGKLAADGLADSSKKDYTPEELDQVIQSIKGKIDSLSSSQQMDMLRLQELSNKRNEAFDMMADIIKKMQDSRNDIIGNIR